VDIGIAGNGVQEKSSIQPKKMPSLFSKGILNKE